MKFLEIFFFEMGYHLRRPATWVFYFAVVGLLLLVMDEIIDYAQTIGGILLNAPMTIADINGFANKFGLLLIAALSSTGGLRDIQARMEPLVYTTSISKLIYFGARFTAIFLVSAILLIVATPLAMLISYYLMAVDESLLGPFYLAAYINPVLFITLPNVFVFSLVLFSFVVLFRQSIAAFLGGGIFFFCAVLSMDFGWTLGKLIDPFGINIINGLQRSLTPLQLNTAVLELNYELLKNRLIWISLGILIGLWAFKSFAFRHYIPRVPFWRRNRGQKQDPQAASYPQLKPLEVKKSFAYRDRLKYTAELALIYFRETIKSPLGWIFPFVLLFTLLVVAFLNKGPFQYPMLPSSWRITLLLGHPAALGIVVMLIIFFAGQLVWREQDARLNEISDAVPMSDGVMLTSKLLCLLFIIISLQLVRFMAGMLVQGWKGYSQIDLGEYLQELLVFQFTNLVVFAAVAVAIHVLINQKLIGHLLCLLIYLYSLTPELLGIEHKLFIFNSAPGFLDSVFWGKEQYFLPWLLMKVYWAGMALLLLIISKLVYIRGRENNIKKRFTDAVKGLKHSFVAARSLFLILSSGGLIFYNTNILNTYRGAEEQINQQLTYEQLYKRYEEVPQPQLIKAELFLELYPKQRAASISGKYLLRNSTGRAVDSIHLALVPELKIDTLSFNRSANALLTDKNLGHLIYRLRQPLEPDDSLQLNFSLRYDADDFSNKGFETTVMEKGSWIKNREWLPAIGYQPDWELHDNGKRRAHGLVEKASFAPHENKEVLYDRQGHEVIDFEMTIGTSEEQTAVAPGLLVHQWKEGNRQYFKYVADSPIRDNLFHVYAGEYKVFEDQWNRVKLRIYHHPEHTANLPEIAAAMKASLAYYTKNYSPYPHSQLTFVETPDPGTGAISLPATIGYSSNFALLDAESKRVDFDLPFAVAAHEIAHQWWAHQLIPAEMEGAYLLSEGFAWYSAFGVVEQEYGANHLQLLLEAMRREYLNPRSKADLPLLKAVDKFHGYRKGPLAMYALGEYIGEEKVNRALRKLLEKFRADKPPYASSLDFYKEVQQVTPDSLQYLLSDLFEKNTYWNLRMGEATYEKAGDGGWRVAMDVYANKVYVDTMGVETKAPVMDWVEIGVYGKNNDLLYLEKHLLEAGKNKIAIQLKEEPQKAGIDPRFLLIDPEMEDNIKTAIQRKASGGK